MKQTQNIGTSLYLSTNQPAKIKTDACIWVYLQFIARIIFSSVQVVEISNLSLDNINGIDKNKWLAASDVNVSHQLKSRKFHLLNVFTGENMAQLYLLYGQQVWD